MSLRILLYEHECLCVLCITLFLSMTFSLLFSCAFFLSPPFPLSLVHVGTLCIPRVVIIFVLCYFVWKGQKEMYGICFFYMRQHVYDGIMYRATIDSEQERESTFVYIQCKRFGCFRHCLHSASRWIFQFGKSAQQNTCEFFEQYERVIYPQIKG